MKKYILFAVAILGVSYSNAQNLNNTNGGYESTRTIDGKKYRVAYYEYQVDKTMDEVWDEISGNFINVGEIHKSINESYCESGDTTEGVGAARFCSIDFSGKEIQIKERITDVQESEDRKEFTYEVYESKGFPAKVFNTWVVRKDEHGKVYLGNVFVLRGKPAMMSKMMMKKIDKLDGLRNAVLGYKHYLETGEKKVDSEIFAKLYPEV
ncbi:MAG: hypothetical protein HRT58_12605 [Crocinitomicaceae bacterium]|nr:hypothetical protein [Flavobacteriales bacterium]NQZ36504.1 hypothetical protein [Crocinitomicaceae bacterium]